MQSLTKGVVGVSGPESCMSDPDQRSCDLISPQVLLKGLTVNGLLSPPPRAVSLTVFSERF